MNHTQLLSQMVSLFLVMLVSSACGTAEPSGTPVAQSATAAPTATAQPTGTPVPPTPTPVPPSATAAPTATAQPTGTPVPPKATAAPAATARLSTAMPTGPHPSSRGYVSMAYDAESDRIILFGGQTGDIYADPAHYNGETWAYNVAANKWIQMKPPSGPTSRGAAILAYDAESDRVILYGGGNDSSWELIDTWAYDYNTNTWQKKASGPAGHLGSSLAYDAESDRIILFGGFSVNSNKLLNDTWSYDFNSDTWTEMKPAASPSPRNFHSMAYDAESDRVIMWGGDVADHDQSVWAYDYNTNTWQKLASAGGPRLRYYMAISYNTKADRMILYGGYNSGNNETWSYDYNTNTWQQLNPGTVPGFLSRQAMAYSPAADRVILFGGQSGSKQFRYIGNTWSYDLSTNTWTNVIPES